MKRTLKTVKLSFSKAELSVKQAGIQLGISTRIGDKEYQQYQDDIKKSILASFGLFGGSSNPNVYFDEATAENIMPKPEDFVRIPFRLLSATTVGAGSWKATDFSKPGILQESVHMFNKKAIYTEHDPEMYNWVGITANPVWQEGYTNEEGTYIPGGVNADMMIDVKTSPKIARGLLLGAIYSNSVTIEFSSYNSHNYATEEEFEMRLGTMHADGTMVRRIADKILNVHESSLVWLGADPFAKLIDNTGNLVNIDYESISYEKETETNKEKYKNEKSFSVGFGIDKEIISLSKYNFNKAAEQQNKNKVAMKKFLAEYLRVVMNSENPISFTNAAPKEGEAMTAEFEAELMASLGKLFPAPTPDPAAEAATSFVKGLKFSNDKGEEVELELSKYSPENVILLNRSDVETMRTELGKVESLKASAKIGEDHLASFRADVLAQYNTSVNNDPNAEVVKLINEANYEALEGFAKQYGVAALAKFEPTCSKCGNAEHITLRKSVGTETGAGGNEGKTVKKEFDAVSLDDLRNQFDKQ